MIERRKSRVVTAGNVKIGGDNPISVQSMLNVIAEDAEGNVRQAVELEKAGCQIIRLTVPNKEAVRTLYAVKNAVSIPVVADIHFDYRCALESVSAGVDKIRINPGNIGDDEKVRAVADACRLHNVPIRIGVNSGSLEKNLLAFTGEENSPFPESFLSIFTSGLPMSRTLKASSDSVLSSSGNNVPFPWVFREKYHEGLTGDIWYLFRLWTEFYHQYFYYCWAGLILFYFILRYFCSPGEKRKRLFHFFEECFFLTGLPACVFMASPGKWDKGTIVCSVFLVPLLCIFISVVLFLAEKYKGEPGIFSGRRFFYCSLPSILAPLFVLVVYQGGGERFVSGISSSVLPQGMQSIVLLLLLAASIANSCIFYNSLKGMSVREIPLLLLMLFLALPAVFLLIAAAGYGGIHGMLIPLVLMSIVQFSSSYRM